MLPQERTGPLQMAAQDAPEPRVQRGDLVTGIPPAGMRYYRRTPAFCLSRKRLVIGQLSLKPVFALREDVPAWHFM
jgi:hypothetical protein